MKRTKAEPLWLPGLEPAAGAALEAADAAERRRALDVRQSFIVQAPAGSGKTELLIGRYLALLEIVERPEAVAAITFTVKAAGEMRARVIESLEAAARGVEPFAAHQKHNYELACRVMARDRASGWNLLANPERMRIQTIDALSIAIARQMPWVARLGAMPGVVEDARAEYREAALRALRELGSDSGDAIECVLEAYDNDATQVAAMLANMLETRDHWLPVIGASADPERVRPVLEAALRRVVAQHLAKLREAIPPGCVAELLELARFAAANAEPGPIAECARMYELPETAESWADLSHLLLTEKGEWRKTVNRRQGFTATNRRMKSRMDALLAAMATAPELEELVAETRRLPPVRYAESDWCVLAALFRLLPRTAAHLRAVFAEREAVDFVEIASAARIALGDVSNPTDLGLAMGGRIEHLLVDEFQDTSTTQFDLLKRLTAGWDDGSHRTLFLVGDPMQSIYRFRQAEVGLFIEARATGVGPLQLGSVELTENFRSARPLIEWVNETFAGIFPSAAEAASGAIPFHPSTAARKGAEGAGVSVHPFIGRDDRAEARRVVELVRAAQARDPESRTAILVRSRAHLAAIAEMLRAGRIAYRAIEIQALAEKPLIQDLVALTRALLHPADRVAWLAVLRAPWCGITLEALHRIAAGHRGEPIWHLLDCELDADSRARVDTIRPTLACALERRGRVPVAALVEDAWLALAGDRLAPEGDADARAYFDLLEEIGARGDIASFAQLAARVAELFASPDPLAGPSVELMTVHKAKGLEFDTVILPGLGRAAKSDDPPMLRWMERPDRATADLFMAPRPARGEPDTRLYKFIEREDHERARYESQRLLYVACTRAKSHLHLLGHTEVKVRDGVRELHAPRAGTLLAHVWSAVQPQFAAAFELEDAAGAEAGAAERVPHQLRRIRTPRAVAAMPDAPPASTARASLDDAGRAERQTGIVVHRLLARIANDGIEAWPAARVSGLPAAVRAALVEQGMSPACAAEACVRALSALENTLASERGRWILAAHRDAASEFQIAGVVDGGVRHFAIDRVFTDERGARWVIDFKTSEPGEMERGAFLAAERRAYQQQLERYAGMIGAGRIGLFFPLTGDWVEWEYPVRPSHA